ncbi:MAG: DUF2442 domain-containing protein [Bacteroidia bacterium]|nr:DUF2442 domain-containing protein [Bacteroidia bacterium]
MYLSVTGVVPENEFILLLSFENGEKRRMDMRPYLNHGIFKELKDPMKFSLVRVNFDTIQWENEADLDPEFLYENSTLVNE